jgi:DNA-directed RNA polymerase specialized sigma24 family protein
MKVASGYQKQKMLEVDELVLRFQSGDHEAGEEVMRRFGCHPDEPMSLYVGKYYQILRKGRFPFKDRDAREFINCFIKEVETRNAMKRFFQYTDVRLKVYETVDMIVSYLSSVPDEDLKQELRCLFIKQMYRYRHIKKSVYFQGYLYNSYNYAIIDYIQRHVRKMEPYNLQYRKSKFVVMNEAFAVDEKSEEEYNKQIMVNTPLLVEDDDLGNAWVRGLTCGEEFEGLSPLYRMILKMHYEDKMADKDIAKSMGMHLNTIFKYRQKAINLIQIAMERISKEGYQ